MMKSNMEDIRNVSARKRIAEMAETCVRCGSCKAFCPTYGEEASEGMSARGRMMLLKQFMEGTLEPSELLDERVFSCILCGACNSHCPLGISVTDAIYEGRRVLRTFDRRRRLLSHGAQVLFKKASFGFKLLKLLEVTGEILPVRKLRPFRLLNDFNINIPDTSLREEGVLFRATKPRGRVAVFGGCTANFLYPHIGRSLIGTLNAMSYDVVLPKGEVCCGAPLRGLGLEEDAAQLAERNLTIFQRMNVEAIVGLCPTCVHYIKLEYKKLAGAGMENAMDVSQFLGSRLPELMNGRVRVQKALRVAYHDPCHSSYHLKVKHEPRQMLTALGFDLLDTEQGCCGFGGTFRVLYQNLSESMLEKRADVYREADMIVTSCPNCILQLKSRINDRKIRHLVEVIDEAVTGERP